MQLPQFPTPKITPEIAKKIQTTDKKEFKKSEAYQKHCAPVKKRHIQLKKQNRVDWWKNNWIGVVTLFVTILTLIVTVLFGLLQLVD